jgi:hypothetical protein
MREKALEEARLAEERRERTPIVEEDESSSSTRPSAYGSSSSSLPAPPPHSSTSLSFKPSGVASAAGAAEVNKAELVAMKAVARYKELQRQREEESMAGFDDV